ncbi:TatA/E family twin arginine-targeting protein translocase [Parathermosynechococcus lividus]
MNVFGIGLPELIVILVVALLIFGPKKLPEIGRSLGKTKRAFEEASREFQDEMKRQTAALEQENQTAVKSESSREPSA